MITSFMLGLIAAFSLVASLFFLRFWRDTRDFFFLPFAIFFFIEGSSRVGLLFVAHPNEGSQWIYLSRLLATLLILFAILKKNYGREG